MSDVLISEVTASIFISPQICTISKFGGRLRSEPQVSTDSRVVSSDLKVVADLGTSQIRGATFIFESNFRSEALFPGSDVTPDPYTLRSEKILPNFQPGSDFKELARFLQWGCKG